MTWLGTIITAIVQGVTEFIPVSSSGHLVLCKTLLDIETPGAILEVTLHFGTLIALLLIFREQTARTVAGFCRGLRDGLSGKGWKQVWQQQPLFRMGWYVILGTVPAAFVGLALKSALALESLFSNGIAAMAMLFITGEILWLTRHCSHFPPQGKLRFSDGIVIGIVQALALLPGISRSGSTISAGLLRGVKQEQAVNFSFLLAIPAMLGASLVEMRNIGKLSSAEMPLLLAGVAIAAIVGYGTLRCLLIIVRKGKLHWFAYYCWAMAVIGATLCWAKQGLT